MLEKARITTLFLLIQVLFLTNFYGRDKLPVMHGVGGNFTAPSSEGYDISLSDYRGNVVLVTFGFTNCPDVCPITLGYINYVYEKLTPEQQKRTKVLFITVDPIQDTPEHMKKFMAVFNKNFFGVSASEENLKKIAKRFNVSYAEVKGVKMPTKLNRSLVETEKGHVARVFNHSISIFLIDKRGKTRGVYYSGSDSDKFKNDIVTLQEEDSGSRGSGKLVFKNFWIRYMPVGRMTALFGIINNHTSKRIEMKNIICEKVSKKSELHLTKIEGDRAQMSRQESIWIEPYTTFVMKPMSYHTMLIGLSKKMVEREKESCRLEFSNYPTQHLEVGVKKDKFK